MGISGIDEDGTLLDFDYREVRVAQAMIEHARKIYLVADHSKIGRSLQWSNSATSARYRQCSPTFRCRNRCSSRSMPPG